MVARYKGSSAPTGGSALERKVARKQARKVERRKLREENGDKRKHNGRPPGRRNRLPTTIKLAAMGAMEVIGDFHAGLINGVVAKRLPESPVGMVGGLLGYWIKVFWEDPQAAVSMGLKLLPPPKAGVDSNPVNYSIPPEALVGFNKAELRILERMFEAATGLANLKREESEGNADDYAKEIGMLPHPDKYKVIDATAE
jgi:hypothetical protein